MIMALKHILEFTGINTLSVSRRQVLRLGRFSCVRLFSRGGDFLITNALILLYGSSWLYAAIILGAAFNLITDYMGQKLWVFKGKQPVKKVTVQEVWLYLLLKATYCLPGLLGLVLFYKFLHFPFFVGSLIVMIAMWFVSFKDFEALFTQKVAGGSGLLHRLLLRSGITYTK